MLDKTVKDYLVSKDDKGEVKAKMFFAVSKPPHITENDTGIWRRFLYQIKK